jgi:hypothetical protein
LVCKKSLNRYCLAGRGQAMENYRDSFADLKRLKLKTCKDFVIITA